MGALKAALTAIFNANTYTSSTSGIASKKIPVTESNGLPSGQIGMSDLASVLGVFALRGNPGSSIDLDNCWSGVLYIRVTDYTVNNWPSNTNGLLVAINGVSAKNTQPNSYVIQIAFDGGNKTWTRVFTNVWSTWKEITKNA